MTDMNVEFFLGGPPGTDYGDYVIQADIWQENLNGVGTWEIIADPNAGGAWPAVNTITAGRPGSRTHITFDDGGGVTTMMRGYVDDVLPYLTPEGVHTQLYRIVGRNRGLDLAEHQVSDEYVATRGDTIITTALGLIPSELTLVAVGAVPGNTLNYEADRMYLADLCREVSNLSTNGAGTNNYDFYVDNTVWPANANLNFFLHGNSSSGVTLTDFAGAANNILRIDPCGESVGSEIKNHITAHAGGVEDHWTDLNAADWAGTNCAVTDDLVVFLNGKGAIRATNNTVGIAVMFIDLTFPRYSYTGGIDMSEPTIGSYNYLIEDSRNPTKTLRLELMDNLGNRIEWYRAVFGGLVKCRNCSDQPTNLEWRKVDFQLGNEGGIEAALAAGDTKGHWSYLVAAAPPFNWADVRRVRFYTGAAQVAIGDYFILDGVEFPNVEPISISQDAASIAAYGQRMKDFYRPDIKNQYELDDYADMQLLRMKDPKQTIRLTAEGQTGTVFPSQTVEVVAPDFGIGGPLIGNTDTYRIIRLHHRVTKNSDESEVPGYTFLTTYDLVRHLYEGTATTQLVDHTTIIKAVDPIQSLLRETRQTESYRRRGGNMRLIP